MSYYRLALGALAVVLLFAPGARSQDYVDGASQFITGLADRAVESLADQTISADERRARFRDIFTEAFAVQGIARFVLGRAWRSATEAQQAEYVDLFESLIIATWTDRFIEYSSLKLEVTGARPLQSANADENTALVSSVVHADQDKNFAVDWRVANQGNLYKITDVLIEGVSLANTHREEFASVLRREGNMDGLLAFMRDKRDGLLRTDVPR